MNCATVRYILIFLFVSASACADPSKEMVSNNPAGMEVAVEIKQPIYPVLVGNKENIILQLIVKMEAPGVLNRIDLSMDGTTAPSDVEWLRIYFSAGVDEFLTRDPFGEDLKPKPKLSFIGNKELNPGDNHIWISYQLSDDANIDNLVGGMIESIVINDAAIGIADKAIPKRMGVALRRRRQDGVNAYRIPGLATTNAGNLIAVYDARYNSSVDLQEDIDVGMSRSTDGGRSWEPMKIIMDMGEWGGKPQNANGVGDPALLLDRQTGTIWVAALWMHGHPGKRAWFASDFGMSPEETGQFILVKSDDEGVTWSDPINITSQIKQPEWQLLLAGPGKGISMKDGTLVFPAQFKDEQKVPFSTLISSTDHGATWQMGTGVSAETTEAQLVELEDGLIMINCRNNEARDNAGVGRVVAVTSDLGRTWQPHGSSITALEESTCMASLIRETFGDQNDLLLFSNPNTHTGRHHMTIKVSGDEGQTWPEAHWLLLDEGNSWGYSCMTRIDDEYVGILYEGSQANLTFQRVKVSDHFNLRGF